MTYQGHLRGPGIVLFFGERPPQYGLDAEDLEDRRGGPRHLDVNGLSDAGQVPRVRPFREPDLLKRPAEVSVNGVSRIGLLDPGDPDARGGVPESVELVRSRIGKGLQEHALHEAEDGGAAADPEGEGHDGDRGEAGIPQKFSADEEELGAEGKHRLPLPSGNGQPGGEVPAI